MNTLTPTEKQAMFEKALNTNPNLTIEEFEENSKQHRGPALEKANPNTQHHRTVKGVVVGYNSREDINQALTECDIYDSD